jgi:hypothetical protein
MQRSQRRRGSVPVENYTVTSDGFSMFEDLLTESAVDDLVSFMEQNISGSLRTRRPRNPIRQNRRGKLEGSVASGRDNCSDQQSRSARIRTMVHEGWGSARSTPATVLERMVSVRLHLDDCPKENGALRVIPGSHTSGKLEERLIQELAERSATVTCAMFRGGVLMMRPLLLHASSASTIPGHRRVIHFDYAAAELPSGMNWAVDQA